MSVAEVEDRTEPEEADTLSWRKTLIALLAARSIVMERKNAARPFEIVIVSERRYPVSGEPYLIEQPVSERTLRQLQEVGAVVVAGRMEAIPLAIPLAIRPAYVATSLRFLGGFKVGLARCLPCYAPVGCQASRGGPILARHLAPGVKGPCPGSGTTPTEWLDRDTPPSAPETP